MYGFLIALGLLNMYAFWLIPWIELIAGLLHVILWIVYAVVLLTLAPRHSTRFVFLEKANASGWTSDFVSFNLGIILLSWGFVGYDAMAHISEVGVFSFFHETFFFHGSIHPILHVYIYISLYTSHKHRHGPITNPTLLTFYRKRKKPGPPSPEPCSGPFASMPPWRLG